MGHRSCGVAAFALASAFFMFDAGVARALTLDEAMRRAREADARLSAARHESAAREADLRQAGARPNPTLALDVENWGGSGELGGFDLTETSLRLGQTFELGGKRARRVELAGLQRDAASIVEHARRAELDAAVRAAFTRSLAFQEKRRVADELEGFAQRANEAVRNRVRAGGSSPVEERRATVEVGALALERTRLEREWAMSLRTLAATWGASAPDFADVSGTLALLEAPPDAEALLLRVDDFPVVALQRAHAAQAVAQVGASAASSKSDLALEAGIRRFEETGDYAGLVSVGLPLPLADRKAAATEAARFREAAAGDELAAARRDAASAVRELASEVASVETEARTLDDALVPEARRVRDESETAYANGLFRFTDVLDAQRTLAELSMRSIDAKARALMLRAELDRITGAATLSEETIR